MAVSAGVAGRWWRVTAPGHEETTGEPIRSRLVIMLPGFEPVSLGAHRRRFRNAAATTAATFGLQVSVGALMPQQPDGPVDIASWTMTTLGPGWRTEAEIVFYDSAAMNAHYAARSAPRRIASGIGAILAMIGTGAFARYVRDGWRFALFCLMPIGVVAFVATLAAAVPVLAAWLLGSLHLVWSLPLAALGAWAGLRYADRKLHLLLACDLWTATRDLARHQGPWPRFLASVCDDIGRRIDATEADEVVVVGHSLGAAPAVMALADERALAAAAKRPVGFLGAGSYLLAVAHHPAARTLRDCVRAVIGGRATWLEAQSLTDPVNFYRSNPARALDAGPPERVSILRVRFRNQLTPEHYNRIKRDFFRIHRQFVMGVERRTPYALHAIIGGPRSLSDIAASGGLREREPEASRSLATGS